MNEYLVFTNSLVDYIQEFGLFATCDTLNIKHSIENTVIEDNFDKNIFNSNNLLNIINILISHIYNYLVSFNDQQFIELSQRIVFSYLNKTNPEILKNYVYRQGLEGLKKTIGNFNNKTIIYFLDKFMQNIKTLDLNKKSTDILNKDKCINNYNYKQKRTSHKSKFYSKINATTYDKNISNNKSIKIFSNIEYTCKSINHKDQLNKKFNHQTNSNFIYKSNKDNINCNVGHNNIQENIASYYNNSINKDIEFIDQNVSKIMSNDFNNNKISYEDNILVNKDLETIQEKDDEEKMSLLKNRKIEHNNITDTQNLYTRNITNNNLSNSNTNYCNNIYNLSNNTKKILSNFSTKFSTNFPFNKINEAIYNKSFIDRQTEYEIKKNNNLEKIKVEKEEIEQLLCPFSPSINKEINCGQDYSNKLSNNRYSYSNIKTNNRHEKLYKDSSRRKQLNLINQKNEIKARNKSMIIFKSSRNSVKQLYCNKSHELKMSLIINNNNNNNNNCNKLLYNSSYYSNINKNTNDKKVSRIESLYYDYKKKKINSKRLEKIFNRDLGITFKPKIYTNYKSSINCLSNSIKNKKYDNNLNNIYNYNNNLVRNSLSNR